jgi:mono/diheme cytochrome c family protein/uncharacterized membrane protein
MSSENPAPEDSAPSSPGTPAAVELFGQRCVKCHGADGTGSRARARLPEIPNFTDASWQARQTDAKMRASILNGKGMEMPAQRGEISEELVGGLVAYVRSCASTTTKLRPRPQGDPGLAKFDEHYGRLKQQMDELRRQYHELPKAAPGGAPSKPSEPGQREIAPQSPPATPGGPSPRELFLKRCAKCHGADGTGNKARERLPAIPDFTNPSWQSRRADSKLVVSILEGKGDDMPPQRGKISEEQAHGLVKYIRSFAPTKGNSEQRKKEEPSEPKPAKPDPTLNSFEERQSSAPPPTRAKADSSSSVQSPSPEQSTSSSPGTSDVEDLFRRRCVKCHGADGTGNKARHRLPEIPDFTNPSWQARRDEAQLMASILDGKGEDMPPARGKVSDEQARGLVTYVRTFALATARPGQAELEGAEVADPGEIEPPKRFLTKMIRWLGRFHPPSVHFPIALITAAAVAEILRMTTGNSIFDSIARYCLWFGSVTAASAGVLGWFLGGFHLTDSSWVLTIHRWLGTSTVVAAALVLVLSEASRRPDLGRGRFWSRVSLLLLAALVSITGFFGGAVVFGLNHYNWPR